MPKVFISHSWEDNEISQKIADNLKRDGADVWIDTSRISGGDSLPDAIGEGIEWCDVFLLVWSKSARDSYYVKLERNCAVDNRKRIIPCVIDNEKVPTILTAFLRIDFNNFEQGYSTLARDLKLNIIEKEPKVISTNKAVPKPEIIEQKKAIFRSKPQTLSEDDVKNMLRVFGFFDSYRNNEGHGFDNKFELKTINGNKVITDSASGLIWQQSGSSKEMNFTDAKKWIKQLNRNSFASFNDWRLPTLEEAMSLMEPEQKYDKYINPIFDNKQSWIWTADQVQGGSRAWVVGFHLGRCFRYYTFRSDYYVLAVRSEQSTSED